jgi:hypothetical protein
VPNFLRRLRSCALPGLVVPQRRTEHHHCLRARDLLAGTQPVDHALEVVDVTDANPDKRIRIAGDREEGLDLWDVGRDALDVVDSGTSGEAELGERLERKAELRVVDDGGVPTDDFGPLESIDTALDGRSRKADESSNVSERPPGVEAEEFENPPVDGVNGADLVRHDNILCAFVGWAMISCVE